MSVIKELKNPMTPKYMELKKVIFSPGFPWCNVGRTVDESSPILESDLVDPNVKDFNLFVHSFITRPDHEVMYPQITSPFAELAARVAGEILLANRIYPAVFYRIAANYVVDSSGRSPKHFDHDFPHQNLLVYLNEFDGGETIVYDSDNNEHRSSPKLDLPIVFDGSLHHCHDASPSGKRFALVATFLELDSNLIPD